MGQQPLHNNQEQCIQHSSIQSQSSIQHTRGPNQGLDHLKKALMACQFPNWALNGLQQQFQLKHNHSSMNNQTEAQSNNNRDNNSNKQNKNISIVIPYIQGLGEKFKRTCNKWGMQVHF